MVSMTFTIGLLGGGASSDDAPFQGGFCAATAKLTDRTAPASPFGRGELIQRAACARARRFEPRRSRRQPRFRADSDARTRDSGRRALAPRRRGRGEPRGIRPDHPPEPRGEATSALHAALEAEKRALAERVTGPEPRRNELATVRALHLVIQDLPVVVHGKTSRGHRAPRGDQAAYTSRHERATSARARFFADPR